MKSKVYTFAGGDATVTWDRRRCIHFEACVHGLPRAFDPDRRPWIDPDQAPADALREVVQRCPTGALHLRLADGTDPEAIPAEARVTVAADGPLYLHGDVEVRSPEGEVLLRDTRVALCRCGLSQNKPLCDNSHQDAFVDPGRLARADAAADGAAPGPTMTVTPRPDGPLLVSGPLRVVGSDGRETVKPKAALCRCGHSRDKPFCDGSHAAAGFRSA